MARILVVDDEQLIRRALQRILEDEGHDVVIAADGEAAWEILEREGVDLLITDLFMPGVDGIELLTRLMDRDDAPPVIAMSGGGSVVKKTDVLTDASAFGAAKILAKPFTPDDARAAVAALLG